MKVFIRNLPYSVTEAELEAFFKDCGPAKAELHINRHTHAPRGTGCVTFETNEAFELALKKHGELMGGRVLKLRKDIGRKRSTARQTGEEVCFGYPINQQVYIGNSGDMEEAELTAIFSVFGYVIEVDIMRWKRSGSPKGFAFIIFEHPESARAALSMHGVELYGRRLRVSMAQAKSKYPKEAQPLKTGNLQKPVYKERQPLLRAYPPPATINQYAAPIGFANPQHAFMEGISGYSEHKLMDYRQQQVGRIAPMAGGVATTMMPSPFTAHSSPLEPAFPHQQEQQHMQQPYNTTTGNAQETQQNTIPSLVAGFGNLSFQQRL